ncbi:hypothetical protein ma106 [Moumouvirus australiensis]|uniref:Uncharacterized protein n=1 Tax=Moumouvirus australiensis TaxID=2109587 RepID=A0A2P1EKS5_9VIRU|nr:hypothetical protein QKC55_gp798 [Moumouvirus australiensis]AVL94492.1 hypothetical protein ma106 [Moumouvirus australiensis]
MTHKISHILLMDDNQTYDIKLFDVEKMLPSEIEEDWFDFEKIDELKLASQNKSFLSHPIKKETKEYTGPKNYFHAIR